MPEDTNDPVRAAVLVRKKTDPGNARRTALLLGIGVCLGLALGVLLTISVSSTFRFATYPLSSTRDSVQVFQELNELRQQINQLNEAKKRQEQEKEEAVRQALQAVTSTVRLPESGRPSVKPSAKKQAGGAEVPPVAKPWDPFAEVDAEIERLEQTQKVLNTILDMFSPKGKEGAKDR